MRFLLPLLAALALAGADPPAAAAAKPYPLDVCAHTGEKLDAMGGAVTKVYEGQEVKFCCKGCIRGFEKDLAANLARIQAAAPAAGASATSATACPSCDACP